MKTALAFLAAAMLGTPLCSAVRAADPNLEPAAMSVHLTFTFAEDKMAYDLEFNASFGDRKRPRLEGQRR